jgi:hypothetical protein
MAHRDMRQLRICAVALLGVLAIAGAATAAPTNRIAIAMPAYVVHSNTTGYAVTLSGYSRRRAVAYLFLDYSGCARTFSAEHKRPLLKARFFSVNGRFTDGSAWTSPYRGSDHACAYLISRASGTLLAKARMSFIVH